MQYVMAGLVPAIQWGLYKSNPRLPVHAGRTCRSAGALLDPRDKPGGDDGNHQSRDEPGHDEYVPPRKLE